MDAELKAKWIAALRSGKYSQARYKLRSMAGSLCCLGVLCEVGGLPISGNGIGVVVNDTEVLDYSPIEERFSIDTNTRGRLVDMNDFEKKTFNEIADFVEASL